MPRTIAVVNESGEGDYVVAEYPEHEHAPLAGQRRNYMGPVDFYLSSGEPLNIQSASRFTDLDEVESYYVEEDQDKEWLLQHGI